MIVKPSIRPLNSGNIYEAFGIESDRAAEISKFIQGLVDKHVTSANDTTDGVEMFLHAFNYAETTEEAFFIAYLIGVLVRGKHSQAQGGTVTIEDEVKDWIKDDITHAHEKYLRGEKDSQPKIIKIIKDITKDLTNDRKKNKDQETNVIVVNIKDLSEIISY